MRRYRAPKLKDGELRVYWGKLPHDSPDLIFAWQGNSAMRADSRYLYVELATQRPDPSVQPLFSKMLPSFVQELEARGYDITTLKFSIMKKSATQC